MPRKIAAGNWKMHGTRAALGALETIAKGAPSDGVETVICLPATLLAPAEGVVEGTPLALGGQDCHAAAKGAHTGDISAPMLAEIGARFVIIGHSERRADHGEGDALIAEKCKAAWESGLTPLLCIGETLEDRDAGQTLDVLAEQLSGSVPDGATAENLVIAYEPVWAIGTGRVATTEQIAEVHADLRARLMARFGDSAGDIALLYGGSVKAGNAADIFAVPDVDGALVGGASLKAEDFLPIVEALGAS